MPEPGVGRSVGGDSASKISSQKRPGSRIQRGNTGKCFLWKPSIAYGTTTGGGTVRLPPRLAPTPTDPGLPAGRSGAGRRHLPAERRYYSPSYGCRTLGNKRNCALELRVLDMFKILDSRKYEVELCCSMQEKRLQLLTMTAKLDYSAKRWIKSTV